MIFGPNGEETTEYNDLEYNESLKLVQLQIDSDYKSDAIDHMKSMLVGKVPDGILKEHPYESIRIIKDVTIARLSYLLSKFKELTGSDTDEDVCIDISKLNGLAVVEARRLSTIIARMNEIHKENASVIADLFVAECIVNSYATMTGLVRDTVATI